MDNRVSRGRGGRELHRSVVLSESKRTPTISPGTENAPGFSTAQSQTSATPSRSVSGLSTT